MKSFVSDNINKCLTQKTETDKFISATQLASLANKINSIYITIYPLLNQFTQNGIIYLQTLFLVYIRI